MDIFLVKPGSQKQIYTSELSAFQHTAIEPPLIAALLAAFLREKGHAVSILDAEAEDIDPREAAERVKDARPRLAVVMVSGTNPSASTMNMDGAEAILKHLREISPATPSLLMGLHPSALPERSLSESSADFVCQGEGLHTLPALLDSLEAGAPDATIEGLWLRRDGRIVSGPPAQPFEDLDSLPMPAWDLLPMKKYRAHNWHCFDRIHERSPYAVVYTSLGCPFRCKFCCINTLYGKPGIRFRSPELVVREIEYLVNEFGIRNIKILDEMFALNEARVIDLCDRLIERKLDLNIWAYARVNTVTERMLPKLKAAGVHWLAYGFESASQRVLKDAAKGYELDMVAKVVEKTYAHGIRICANYIFGLPEDDYDSMHETFKAMLDINAEWANIYSAMAYPGSKLYEQAVREGLPLPETWLGYSQYSADCLPLPTKYLSGGQVLAFRDYAFNAYFRSPRYLNMIHAKFGPRTADYVAQMAAHTLARKHASYVPEQRGKPE